MQNPTTEQQVNGKEILTKQEGNDSTSGRQLITQLGSNDVLLGRGTGPNGEFLLLE